MLAPLMNLPPNLLCPVWGALAAGLTALFPVADAEVLAPLLSPHAADSPVALDLTVTCPTPGAEIRYTLNGIEPTRFDPIVASGGTVHISRNAVVKARAWLGSEASPVASEDYRITGSISSGDQHGLALSVSGRVWSWGNQAQGRLGNGQTTGTQVTSPVQVLHGIANFETGAALAAGFNHSLVQDQQGVVWSFGRNASGQLGNNSTTDSVVPVQVLRGVASLEVLDDAVAIAAGQDWSLALAGEGEVLSWGSQSTGRLGGGATSGTRHIPGSVFRGDTPEFPALSGIHGIAAGPAFGLAREANAREVVEATGKVWSWGYNNTGQLGHGTTSNTSRAFPVKLNATTLLTDAWDVSAGEAHAVIVRWHATDPDLQGSVWAAGNRAYGHLGNGSTAAGSVTFPTPVVKEGGALLLDISQVAAGSAHTLALDGDGCVWAWGYNGYGQLGDGGNANRGYAAKVKNPAGSGDLSGIVRVAAGGDGLQGASMALSENGTIYVWGRNHQGQLGNGETSLYATKLPVAHAQNHVIEGAPAITLTHTVSASVEKGSVAISAYPSHTGPGGVDNINRVEVFLNGQLSATFTGGIWAGTVPDLVAGNYHGYGLVFDDDGVAAMSAPFSFEIELDPELDKDGDGLKNGVEQSLGTDPLNADTDGDGMEDGFEQWSQFSPLTIEVGTNGPNGDADADEVTNKSEHDQGRVARLQHERFAPADVVTGSIRWFARSGFWYTPQYSRDLNHWTPFPGGFHGENQEIEVDLVEWYGGQLPASLFVRLKYGPESSQDSDSDGLSDFDESLLATNAFDNDSDDDGILDGREDGDSDGIDNQSEVNRGTDPADEEEFPAYYVYARRNSTQLWGEDSEEEEGAPAGHVAIQADWDDSVVYTDLFDTPRSASDVSSGLGAKIFPESPPIDGVKVLVSDVPFAGAATGFYSKFWSSVDSGLEHERVWLRKPLQTGQTSHPTHAFITVTSRPPSGGGGDPNPEVELVEVEFPSGSTTSAPVDLDPDLEDPPPEGETTNVVQTLVAVDLAPEFLEVNSDFDEGRIDPATGYAMPDCDDDYVALEAERNHLDGRYSANQRITAGLHPGFFGVNPTTLGGPFWAGATVTIRKVAKTDAATGHPESGHVRLYGKWGEGPSEYRAITPYDFNTLATVNLCSAGINGVPSESVYGAASPFPAGTSFFLEGVHPGKITLEWRYQKGTADVKFEQSFEVVTHRSAPSWRLDLDYKIRLDTDDDPSGQIRTIEFPLLSDGYRKNMERATEFYDFYRECYHEPLRSNPSAHPRALSWAGLALLAGSQVVGGLSDSEYGRLALGGSLSQFVHNYIAPFVGGWAVNQIDALQVALFDGGWRIFRSLGWQLHAYRSSGYRAINHVAVTTGDADAVALALAWEELHLGVLDNDWTLLNSAAQKFADHEQNQVIVPTWTSISGMTSGPIPVGSVLEMMFSVLGKNPCTPSGLDFIDLFPLTPPPVSLPSGNLADATDRWTWIMASTPGGILDTWDLEPFSRKYSLTVVPLRDDAQRFSFFSTGGPATPIQCWDHEDTP